MRFRRVALPGLAALLLSAGGARADEAAAAEALFQEARRLMEAERYAEACPKLEESQRLDPGTGTLWHLARCYEETDRLASAWAKYHELAALARGRGERAKVRAALGAAREVEPRLHELVVEVPPESRVEGLEVHRDGARVGPGAWNTGVPVDRGTHRIRASAPGRAPWQTEVTIRGEAGVTRVTVPPLEPRTAPASPEASGEDGSGAGGAPRRDAGPWYRDRIGWGLAISGAVLLGAGGGAFWRGASLVDRAGEERDLADRDRLLDEAEGYRLAGTVLLVAGGAAAAAGVITLALHPKDPEPEGKGATASIALRRGGILVGVAGSF